MCALRGVSVRRPPPRPLATRCKRSVKALTTARLVIWASRQGKPIRNITLFGATKKLEKKGSQKDVCPVLSAAVVLVLWGKI